MSSEGGEMMTESADGQASAAEVGSTRQRSSSPKGAWLAWIAFTVLIIGVGAAAMFQKLQGARLGEPLPKLGAVPAFGFTNEKGTSVTLADLKGRPWVVDFIFTRCGGQCPLMTRHMMGLQGWLRDKGHTEVQLVSVTVDPETDTPEKLAEYGKTFHADPGQWTFLTAAKPEIYDLITTGFKLGVEENRDKPVTEMFVHSNKFALVDAEGQIRGYFVLEEEPEMKRMQAAIRRIGIEQRESRKNSTSADGKDF
ncbi:MAG: SCO family protein [Candidatus Sumerlaeaceae bacterium]